MALSWAFWNQPFALSSSELIDDPESTRLKASAHPSKAGGLLVVPTESSYGLAVDPRDARGVATLAAIKGRGAGKSLPVVIASTEQLPMLGLDPHDEAVRRLAHLWPAPLSLALQLAPPLPAATTTLAVRVPEHALLRALLGTLGPLTATSANRGGEPPALTPDAAMALVAGLDAIVVDDGALPGGLPSTLVSLTEGVLAVHRLGRYPLSRLRDELAAEVVGARAEERG